MLQVDPLLALMLVLNACAAYAMADANGPKGAKTLHPYAWCFVWATFCGAPQASARINPSMDCFWWVLLSSLAGVHAKRLWDAARGPL